MELHQSEQCWVYDCERCDDGGMVSVWCGEGPLGKPWHARGTCGRKGVHPAHEWACECLCVPTNPTIQRRKASRVKYAAEPMRKQRHA
jgi:hypothetical protein